MATSVDEKVVQLTLDQKQFSNESQNAINSLDKLKKSLEFEGAIDSFEEVEKGVKKIDMSPLEKGVEKVSMQFDALHTIADAALRNITNRVISAGENLIKSLSIDQVTAGWDKFGDKTRSVGTLISQGFDISTVTDQLSRLNWYTDETSYDFTEMVANIAKFTATGKGLEESVIAMEGIANWAAMSGQNAQTASHAMYQLSQAMGAGVMRLEDYRSIQNASMDTDEFRQKALDAAVALGTLQKVGDDTYKSLVGNSTEFSKSQFATNLTQGAWFTSDVMMQVFKDYSAAVDQIYDYAEEKGVTASEAIEVLGDKVDAFGLKAFKSAQEARTFSDAIDATKDAVSTGWMNTFEYIFGNYEEAKVLWTDLANIMWDVFAASGEARNEMLSMWKDDGGRDDFIEGLRSLVDNLIAIIDIFKEAWGEAFWGDAEDQIENQAKALLKFTEGFKNFAKAIKPTEESAQNLKDILKALFTTLKSVMTVVKTVGSALEPIFKVLNRIAGTVLQLIGDLARLVNMGLEKIFTEERLQTIYSAINLIAKVIEAIATVGLNGIVDGINTIGQLLSGILLPLTNNFNDVEGIFYNLTDSVSRFFSAFSQGESVVNRFINGLISVLGGAITGVIAIVKTLWDVLTGKGIDFEGNFGDVSGWFADISKTITVIDIPGKLQPAIDTLKEFASWMYTFFLDLFNADSNIRHIFSLIKDELIDFWEWAKDGLAQLTLQDVESMILVAGLLNVILELSNIEKAAAGVVKSFKGTIDAVTNLVKTFTGATFADAASGGLLSKLESIANKTKWVQIGIGITMMISALNQLSRLPRDDVIQALITLGLAMGMLAAVVKQFEKLSGTKVFKAKEDKNGGNIGLTILAISGSLLVMVQAMKQIQPLLSDLPSLIGSFGMVGALAATLGLVVKALSGLDTKGMASAGASMLLMSISINALIAPIKMIAAMDLESVAKGVLSVIGLLVALGGAAGLMAKTNWSTLLSASIAFMSMAAAIDVLALGIYALTNVENLGEGILSAVILIGGLTAAIIGIGAASQAANPAGILALSAAMLSFSVTMLAFAGAVNLMANVPWQVVLGAVGAFVAVLGALVIAGNAATAGIVGLLGISAVVVSFGAAVALVGVGVGNLAEGIAKFAVLIVGLGLAAKQFGDEFPEIIQNGVDAVEMILRGLLQMIPDLTFDIAAAISSLIVAIKVGIYGGLPQLVEGVMAIATAIMAVIARLGKPFMEALIAMIKTLNDYIPDLMAQLAVFVDRVFVGLGDLIWDALVSMVHGIASSFGLGDLLGDWIDSAHTDSYKIAAGIADQAEKGVTDSVDDLKKAGEKAGEATLQGWIEAQDPGEPNDAYRYQIEDIPNQVDLGVSNILDQLGNAGSTMGAQMVNSFGDTTSSGLSNVFNYASEQLDSFIGSMGNIGTDLFTGTKKQIKHSAESERRQKILHAKLDPGFREMEQLQKDRDSYLESLKQAKETASELAYETGNDWAKGLSSGVSSSTSKSRTAAAAKSQADTVANAFADEIDKINRDNQTAEKLYKLWTAKNPTADELEKSSKEIELQTTKVNNKLKMVEISQKIYEQTLEEMGESSKETHEAYMDMLDDQIELLTMQQALLDMQDELRQSQADMWASTGELANKILASWQPFIQHLEDMGYSLVNISNASFAEAGGNLDDIAGMTEELKRAATEVQNIMHSYVGYFKESQDIDEYQDAVASWVDILANGVVAGIPDLRESLKNYNDEAINAIDNDQTRNSWYESGQNIDAGIMDGLTNSSSYDDLMDSFSSLGIDGLDAFNDAVDINSPSKKFMTAGEMIDEGIIDGLKNRSSLVSREAERVAMEAYEAACEVLEIESPSRLMKSVGEYFDLGLAEGITNYGYQVEKSTREMVYDLMNASKGVLSQNQNEINRYLQRMFDLDSQDLSIQAVVNVDTSEVDNAMNEIERLQKFGAKTYANISTEADRTTRYGAMLESLTEAEAYRSRQLQSLYDLVDSRMRQPIEEVSVKETEERAPVNVSFVQNNTSPKALSRTDIYRDTQKQLNTFANKFSLSKKR